VSKQIEMIVRDRHLDKYKDRYPLIFKDALLGTHILEDSEIKEGSLIKLSDTNGNYIATGYFGIQNKGIGWVLSNNPKEEINLTFFLKKIYSSIEKRLGLYNNPKTNCFRVFNGEGDGIGGLTIDFFNGFYLINWYSQGIYAFRALVLEALEKSVEYDGLYEKMRFNLELDIENDGFIKGKKADLPLVVNENGEKFAIYFDNSSMVGLFLDQRDVRHLLRNKYAKGRTILNTFAYTGAFSVFASKGGAKKTVSVDLANRTLERTKENFALNSLNDDDNQIVIEDVFHYFDYARKNRILFDMVILDPPSFAKSKSFTFKSDKDYPKLISEAVSVTNNHGIIIASNNLSSIDEDKFKKIIGQGFNLADARFSILEFHQLPKDFRTHIKYPESNYLKVAFIEVLK